MNTLRLTTYGSAFNSEIKSQFEAALRQVAEEHGICLNDVLVQQESNLADALTASPSDEHESDKAAMSFDDFVPLV